jgi:DNA mismatch repair protein MutL
MALRIKILPENLTNKIAAGEVVERPASAVKELVENAIDAGASEIVVEIESGGKRLIKVSDNGYGMSRDDALLALERHATSKILVDDDLLAINTLGFRGEALPSLAAVSRFILATKERDDLAGTEIYCEGGRIREVKERGMATGTVIEIRNLFFNTPARLKFLKSRETEAGHVAEQVTRLALSRPEVRFTCVSDGRVLFKTLEGTVAERIAALLGRTIAGDLYPVLQESGALRLTGCAGRPECSRSAATHLYTFVNGRYVRDRVFQHAVMQSYRRFLERGRYPVAVLFLELSPGDVDVNVHPTKHEVRFRQQAEVHDFIMSALENMLQATPWIGRKVSAFPVLEHGSSSLPPRVTDQVREVSGEYQPALAVHTPGRKPQDESARCPGESVLKAHGDNVADSGFFAGLRVLGCYIGNYLLCQDGEDLLLLDQHAAHERIAFERLKREFSAGSVESQGLLFPEILEFSPAECQLLGTYLSDLAKLGFVLEDFGGGSRKLQAVPRIVAAADRVRVLRDILGELTAIGRSRSYNDIVEDLLMRIACHSVVRGNTVLIASEVSALLTALDAVSFASNCPHGRPVFRRISRSDVEKMFKRV